MCFLCFYLHVVGSMLDAWKGSKALHIRCRRFAIFIHCIFFYKFCQHCGCRGMRSAFKLFFTDKTGIIQSYKWTSPFPILGLLVVFFIQILTKHSLSKHLRTWSDTAFCVRRLIWVCIVCICPIKKSARLVWAWSNTFTTFLFRVKSGNFGHQVNSDIHLQTLEIQMRRLLMSRLIRLFTVCLDNWFFSPIIKIWNNQSRCLNLANSPNLPDFSLLQVLIFCEKRKINIGIFKPPLKVYSEDRWTYHPYPFLTSPRSSTPKHLLAKVTEFSWIYLLLQYH